VRDVRRVVSTGGLIAAVICGVVARGKGYGPVLFAILESFFSISTLGPRVGNG